MKFQNCVWRESSAASKVQHPQVVEIFEKQREPGRLTLVYRPTTVRQLQRALYAQAKTSPIPGPPCAKASTLSESWVPEIGTPSLMSGIWKRGTSVLPRQISGSTEYNQLRPHSSLGYRTSEEFAAHHDLKWGVVSKDLNNPKRLFTTGPAKSRPLLEGGLAGSS